MNSPQFLALETQQIRQLAASFHSQGTRKIFNIHIHATHNPTIADFNELKQQLMDRSRPAGLAICQRLWQRHTKQFGWAHIGQHLLIDPDGTLWLGRPWILPPVSVMGHNGNALSGPLCIGVVGDFATGREVSSEKQYSTLTTTLAGLLDGLKLNFSEIRNSADLGICEHGSAFDMEKLGRKIKKARQSQVSEKSPDSPLNEKQYESHHLLNYLLANENKIPLSVQQLEAACGIDKDTMPGKSRLSEPSSRGSSASEASLTPHTIRKLKRHVINLRLGELSDTGDFCTTESDLDALVNRHISNWIKNLNDWKKPRVLIYAHGGLNREEEGLAYAASLTDWWLENGIYPVFFVWETGIIESVMQLIEEKAVGGRGLVDDLRNAASDAWDAGVEALIRNIGQDFWNIMKLSAQRASESPTTGGAFKLAKHLERLKVEHPTLEYHAIGHSAGAIFQAHFLDACARDGSQVPFESLTLLAPACTVPLFRKLLLDRIDGQHIKRLHLFNLDKQTERQDSTVPVYGKSLLHLVSDGFEGRRDTPILGMERALDADPDLARSLGLGSIELDNITVVFSPTETGAPESLRASATTHGGLSRDPTTLSSVARLILGLPEAVSVKEPTFASGARGVHARLFDPLSSRIDDETLNTLFRRPMKTPGDMFSVVDTAAASETSLMTPRSGIHKALCIGIDEYPGDARLHYCVADALAWQATLMRLGFNVDLLTNKQATQQGILDAIRQTVDNARAGDVIVIQYSGHGIQFPDTDGDEEDASDEALVPVDSAHQYFVSDDDLWETLQSVSQAVQLYVFMDCCHSRSNSRVYSRASENPDRRSRRIIPDQSMIDAHRRNMLPRRRSRGNQEKSIERMRHIKFSACSDHEQAFEEKGQGNFTRAVLAVLNNLVAGMSNEEARLAFEEKFTSDARQQPGLECPTNWKRQPFFGGLGIG